jgi:hypothetical protein
MSAETIERAAGEIGYALEASRKVDGAFGERVRGCCRSGATALMAAGVHRAHAGLQAAISTGAILCANLNVFRIMLGLVLNESCYPLEKPKGAPARPREILNSGANLGADAETSTSRKQSAKLVSGKCKVAAPRNRVQNLPEDIVRAVLSTRPVIKDASKSGGQRQNRQDAVVASCSQQQC